MKCMHCPVISNFACSCANLFLCNNHLGGHQSICSQPFKKLKPLPTKESRVFKQKLMKQIQDLKTLNSKIQTETKKIIIKAETYANSARIKIKNFKDQLLRILNLEYYHDIQKQEIEEITIIKVTQENLEINIERYIDDSFNTVLQKLPEISIPYAYLPILILPSNNWSLQYKKNYFQKLFGWNQVTADQILFSKDCNLCFYCKNYLGIIK